MLSLQLAPGQSFLHFRAEAEPAPGQVGQLPGLNRRQERIKAYVCLSVPFLRRNPKFRIVDGLRAAYGEDYYICIFQEPGKMEAEIAEAGTTYVLKNILTTRQTGPPILPKGKYGIGFNPDVPGTLPSFSFQ
ncbi:unnamed protein product [Lathyrus sativus]|nr:unnamed protein product [Lathyrus sativus]